MRSFFVADLNVRGELRMKAEYTYEHLEQVPGAADMIVTFATRIWRDPEEFETPLHPGRTHLTFRWKASAPTAGVGTARSRGDLASVSLLASGLNPEADHLTLEAFQRHLLQEFRDTGYEPAFGLMEIEERPLVATVNFLSPEDPTDQLLIALADRCFAAAYFRYHGLA